MNNHWLITSMTERDEWTEEPLFWSNTDGWGDLSTADIYTTGEKEGYSLPADGLWVPISKSLLSGGANTSGLSVYVGDFNVMIEQIASGLELRVTYGAHTTVFRVPTENEILS